ncbi:MAG: hypothetical protein CM15mP84_05750 [Cellvibrionales bacterium]|nr:MAG: hypothetical protein CM15mP84_05750 [Cellvibrionales bacterium]
MSRFVVVQTVCSPFCGGDRVPCQNPSTNNISVGDAEIKYWYGRNIEPPTRALNPTPNYSYVSPPLVRDVRETPGSYLCRFALANVTSRPCHYCLKFARKSGGKRI